MSSLGLDSMGMTQALRIAAQVTPSKIATRQAGREQSWAQVRENVMRLAGALKELGVQTGDRVAILALNSDRYTEFQFAVWWAGAVIVPMNVRWSPAENAYSLNDSGAEILFVDKTFSAMLPAIRPEVSTLKHVIYLDGPDAPQGMPSYDELLKNDPIEDANRTGEDLAGLYYTGGTTGFPKGVMLPHRALWYNSIVCVNCCGLETEHVYLHAAPMFHLADIAMSSGVNAVGAENIYMPMFNPAGTIDMIEKYQVTHALLVPTMLTMVLQDPSFDPSRLSSLQFITYGGSAMPEGTMRAALEHLPHVKFAQGYGQTELAPFATVLPASQHDLSSPRLMSAGRAVPGSEIRIVDEELNDVITGEVGEIMVKSPGVMHGYWKQPEQTDATLIDGWVLTGDGGYRDADGFIFVVDRMKDMIVTGGENVFSAEVENAISTHPAVAEVAVIGIPSDKWGEAVHAVIVPRANQNATEAEIIEHCRPQIANYKLPRSVSFRNETLPLSGAGKILKRELRQPFWEGAKRQVN